jgi:hypothetical protein
LKLVSHPIPDDLKKIPWVVTPAKAGVHPAEGGMEITKFRLSPE